METTFQKQGYSDPTLERELEAQHRQILRKAKIEGEHFAKSNRPRMRGDNIEPYVSALVSPYEGMAARIHLTVNAENHQAEAKMESDASEEKNKALSEKLQKTQTEKLKVEHEMQEKDMSLEELPYLAPKKSKIPIPLILGIVETAFGAAGFQLLGDNLLFAIVISAGITFALILLSKYLVEQLIENTQSSKRKAMLLAGASLIALMVFYILASLRSRQFVENADIPIQPIHLVFINVLFFVVTCVHYYSLYRTKAQRKRYQELMHYKKKLVGYAQEEHQLAGQIDALKKAKQDRTLIHMSKPGYIQWFIEQIRNWRAEAIETFKAANLAHRPDRQTPDCFYTHQSFIQ